MKSPDKDVIMTFRSIPSGNKADCWVVKLTFPASASASSQLKLSAEDGLGGVVEHGVFHFMGNEVEIENGIGGLSYADFIAGIHEKQVWLIRPGAAPLPGGLTFE